MRRETLIAIVVAVVLGGVAVYLANSYLIGAERRQDQQELVRVAVATVPIEFGTELSPEKVRFASIPRATLPPGAFTSADQLFPKGERRVAVTALAVNEPILPSKISGAGVNASIAAILPAGMRATAVRINDVSGVAGFIQPADSVDVLITRSFPGTGGQITDVLLQDVRVLAIGGTQKGADGKPIRARNATLQVSPLDAQKLTLAQEIGSLSLVLRKPGQQEDMPFVETVSLDDLRYNRFGGSARPVVTTASAPRPAPVVRQAAPVRRAAAPAPRPAAAPKRTNSVEVVRGTAGAQYEVGGNSGN